ncbi:MAG: HD-GYP domain-containing protein, partial [Eubacteriales bacterium]
VYLTDIKSLRDHTFDHSVNVCILSLLTALSMGYDHQQLLELGAGALLHDVGKAAVLDKIVNSTKLFIPDEYQQIQKHVDYGYEALKKAVSIGSFAADVAWQHHERYNGSGYPRKLAGNDIHEHARIVAVADVYNALSTARPYREGLLLHEAEEAIRRSRGTDFDPDIAAEFIRITVPFPLGSMVLLNSGVKGIVVSINADFPTRPRIQMLYNDKGDQVEGIHIVDLMRDQALFVQKLI